MRLELKQDKMNHHVRCQGLKIVILIKEKENYQKPLIMVRPDYNCVDMLLEHLQQIT